MKQKSVLQPPDRERIPVIQNRLHRWYQKNRRDLPWRNTRDPYRIWVSEIMLQQTQVNTVLAYYARFLKRFPDLPTLARARQQSVLKIWEGLGYYARARNLHKAAQIVLKEYKGIPPKDWDAFRKLPGVGEYIAAAVLSIAYNQPYAVVDGNVKRVLARLFEIDRSVNDPAALNVFKDTAGILLDPENPATHNQAVMELGALVCKPKNPDCMGCPLCKDCRAFQNKSVSRFPKRKKRKPVPQVHITVGVVHKNGRVLITQRKPKGLLGGLWEFPGGEIQPNETPDQACVREIKEATGINIEVENCLARVKHAYTHFKVEMDVFSCRHVSGRVKLKGPAAHRWIKPAELKAYPLHKANHKFIQKI